MFTFFKKLRIVFTHGPELKALLDKVKSDDERAKNLKEMAERKRKSHHLNLCYEHQQEEKRSHYSPGNCDYCKMRELAGVN